MTLQLHKLFFDKLIKKEVTNTNLMILDSNHPDYIVNQICQPICIFRRGYSLTYDNFWPLRLTT